MEFGLIVLGSLLFIGFVFYLEHICTKRNDEQQRYLNASYHAAQKLRDIHK